MSNEAFIRIPIGDWITALMREEADIQTAEDILGLVQKHSTVDVARMMIASRHLKKSPESILPADKMLLEQGGRSAVASIVKAQTVKVQVGEHEIEIPILVGSVEVFGGDELPEGESPDGYTPSIGEESIQRAKDYLAKRVPGHIRSRLELLAANHVSLGPLVAMLKQTIDQIVDDLKA